MARHNEARLQLLGRYFDGEATPQEAEQAERILETDPELAKELFAVQSVGALLKAEVEDVSSQIDFTYFASKVLAEAEARKPLTMWERVEEFFRERFGLTAQLWLPGAVVAAAALAAFLIARPHEEPGLLGGPRNELVITKVDTDKDWSSHTIDDEGTTILWIHDEEQE